MCIHRAYERLGNAHLSLLPALLSTFKCPMLEIFTLKCLQLALEIEATSCGDKG